MDHCSKFSIRQGYVIDLVATPKQFDANPLKYCCAGYPEIFFNRKTGTVCWKTAEPQIVNAPATGGKLLIVP